MDQPERTRNGALTQNGRFVDAVRRSRQGGPFETVKAYEKLFDGVWSFKGFFNLIDYRQEARNGRMVFVFTLRLSSEQEVAGGSADVGTVHTRLIPTEVKKEVWRRDKGKCVLCGIASNLHFDHDIPYSKGGASISSANIRLLCARHNLAKSDKIE